MALYKKKPSLFTSAFDNVQHMSSQFKTSDFVEKVEKLSNKGY
jgi:hypothetical protein